MCISHHVVSFSAHLLNLEQNDDDYVCARSVADGVAMSDEKRLIKHLLDQYETVGRVGRPVFNTSQTIKVYYGLALIQLLDLDEKNQVLTTNVWSRYVSLSLSALWRLMFYSRPFLQCQRNGT